MCEKTTFPDRLSAHRFCHRKAPPASRDPQRLGHRHPQFPQRLFRPFRRCPAAGLPRRHRSHTAPAQLRPSSCLLGVARADPRSQRFLPESRRAHPELGGDLRASSPLLGHVELLQGAGKDEHGVPQGHPPPDLPPPRLPRRRARHVERPQPQGRRRQFRPAHGHGREPGGLSPADKPEVFSTARLKSRR